MSQRTCESRAFVSNSTTSEIVTSKPRTPPRAWVKECFCKGTRNGEAWSCKTCRKRYHRECIRNHNNYPFDDYVPGECHDCNPTRWQQVPEKTKRRSKRIARGKREMSEPSESESESNHEESVNPAEPEHCLSPEAPPESPQARRTSALDARSCLSFTLVNGFLSQNIDIYVNEVEFRSFASFSAKLSGANFTRDDRKLCFENVVASTIEFVNGRLLPRMHTKNQIEQSDEKMVFETFVQVMLAASVSADVKEKWFEWVPTVLDADDTEKYVCHILGTRFVRAFPCDGSGTADIWKFII